MASKCIRIIENLVTQDLNSSTTIVDAILSLPFDQLTEIMNDRKVGNYVIQTCFDTVPAQLKSRLSKAIQCRYDILEHKSVIQMGIVYGVFEALGLSSL
jgi:hypothetical protein